MPTRLALGFLALLYACWVAACSSGLGNNLPPSETPVSAASTNLPVGLDLGFVPTSPVIQPAVAGVVVPAIGATEQKEVLLLGFATAASSANGDGAGTPLSRDATNDLNGLDDVFVAAIAAQDVETRAFSQSLAGKFRHPRCTTCHSMQSPTTTAFATATEYAFPYHAGPAPGPGFPNNDPVTCAPCHVTSTAFPVPTWQAPAASFDMRDDTVAELADRANRIPAGDVEHFVSDARVLWALDSGILPNVGGRNGVADDDHDGVDEPEDRDGTPRPVPGGSVNFLRDIQEWIASGRVVSAGAAAVRDVTLVSRASGGGGITASNGASNRPKLLWVANGSFNPTSSVTAFATNPVGTLHVVYESTGSNIAGTDANGAADVFRTTLQLRAEEDPVTGLQTAGALNLVYVSTTLVSALDATPSTAGNAASTRPVIGGASGEIIAFQSLATDLVAGFVDGNGGGSDVFVRKLGTSTTELVSASVGSVNVTSSGSSENPAIDATGVAVAFDSTGSDLIGLDTNLVRDVYHARVDGNAPFTRVRSSVTDTGAEGTGGDSTVPAIHVTGSGRVRVAFQSAKTNLAAGLVAPTNVFLFDSATGATTLLNQRIAASGNAIGNGAARAPAITTDGGAVVFESDASNLDVLRTTDLNRATDVFLVETAQVANGNVLPFRLSLTATTGADANGASTAPVVGSFTGSALYPVGFVAYTTTATNVGTSDTSNVMVAYLSETSGVFADFTPSTVRGAVPLQVTFTDESSGTPTAWEWDFQNDGVVDSTAQNPSFVYETPGSYSVRLVARNAVSSGTATEVNLILAVGVPDADFTASATTGAGSLTVNFTDTSTQSPTSWQWDFTNDGVVDSTVQNPTNITFPSPGTYTVHLVATNEAGSGTETKTGFIQVFNAVVAEFSGTPLAGVAPFAVTFTNQTTGDATSYAWDFDNDGIVDSTDQNPAPFTYTSAGNYTVVLTASGPGGTDTETKASYVAAAGAVVAQFTADATSQYNNVAVQFTDQTTGTVNAWAWDFQNDGITDSTLQNPSFTFTTPGTYSVRLTASGPGGTDSELKTNYITSVVSSVSITIDAAKDTSIYSENTANGNGDNPQLVCGNAATLAAVQQGIRRCLVEFDVAGVIPANATILTASLQLTCTYDPLNPTGSQTVSLRRVLTEWTEGTNNSAIGGGGAATGNGATWANATSGGSPVAWTAGGSFTGTVSASTSVNTSGAYTWATNATMVSDVQTWLDSAPDNHGWIVRAGETSGTRTAKVFGSRTNATAGSRPRLNVTYRPALN